MQKKYRWVGVRYLLLAATTTLLNAVAVDYNGNPIVKGKVVLTPQSIYNGGYLQSVTSPLIVGTLNQSFGGFLTPAPAGTTLLPNFLVGSSDVCKGVAIQPDSKIVLAGVTNTAGAYRYSVARLLSNGQLDSLFNGTGYYVLPGLGTNNNDQCNDVALQSDGKIVLAGFTRTAGAYRYSVIRLLSNGQLDDTFNGTGYYVLPAIGTNNNDQCNAVVLQSDGKIVLAGSSNMGGGTYRYSVARLLPNGQIDLTFNGTGYYVLPQFAAGSDDQCYGVVLQSDGKIVLGGWMKVGGVCKYSAARLLTNGQLDLTFNGTGYYVLPQFAAGNNDECYAVALQSTEKIVLAGYSIGVGITYSAAQLTNEYTLADYQAEYPDQGGFY